MWLLTYKQWKTQTTAYLPVLSFKLIIEVIAKLTDGKATHVPYRDSKLTRLLQSSLSGHGRVSLICTVTPASSSTEETHNTLKFAHRTKHVEIQASQNKIMDEKSLIKKYQKEILSLKQELEQLRRGMTERPYLLASGQDDLVTLKQQFYLTTALSNMMAPVLTHINMQKSMWLGFLINFSLGVRNPLNRNPLVALVDLTVDSQAPELRPHNQLAVHTGYPISLTNMPCPVYLCYQDQGPTLTLLAPFGYLLVDPATWIACRPEHCLLGYYSQCVVSCSLSLSLCLSSFQQLSPCLTGQHDLLVNSLLNVSTSCTLVQSIQSYVHFVSASFEGPVSNVFGQCLSCRLTGLSTQPLVALPPQAGSPALQAGGECNLLQFSRERERESTTFPWTTPSTQSLKKL
eukprot:Gb_35641 [translate_table: standard]